MLRVHIDSHRVCIKSAVGCWSCCTTRVILVVASDCSLAVIYPGLNGTSNRFLLIRDNEEGYRGKLKPLI